MAGYWNGGIPEKGEDDNRFSRTEAPRERSGRQAVFEILFTREKNDELRGRACRDFRRGQCPAASRAVQSPKSPKPGPGPRAETRKGKNDHHVQDRSQQQGLPDGKRVPPSRHFRLKRFLSLPYVLMAGVSGRGDALLSVFEKG